MSLAANQYYAHPRNAFWPIMGVIAGAHPTLPYAQRLKVLTGSGIMMWEALQSCVRLGSLDTAIRDEVPNDFNSFLAAHTRITHIFFNGAKAEQSFRKHVLPTLEYTELILEKLPSTSPAHAGMSLVDKLEKWQDAFERAGFKTKLPEKSPL